MCAVLAWAAPAAQQGLALNFRDTRLGAVFETLSRHSGLNFVFDQEVRSDTRLSLSLRHASVDEALRLILALQQLEQKWLTPNTVLIYPATPAKRREHQELQTRSFYLNSADPKQVQALLRGLLKTRDLVVDERLNLVMMRDTPETVALAEQLIAGLDRPDAELLVELELLEVASSQSSELGIDWPSSLQRGLAGDVSRVPWGAGRELLSSIANPALVARLRGNRELATLIAKPQLRLRNRDKSRIELGGKLPVFGSSASPDIGVTTNISYQDIGLKLALQPQVQSDGEVVLKLDLELSYLLAEVRSGGNPPATAYRIGQRSTSTVVRLRDGETQLLAGLIGDSERQTARGLPGLSGLPVLGRLFGVGEDSRSKSDIVLLITPRLLRLAPLSGPELLRLASGRDADPGAASLRLRRGVVAASGAPSGGGAELVPETAAEASADGNGVDSEADSEAVAELQTSGSAAVGETLSVSLHNKSFHLLRGELRYDLSLFAPAEGGAAANTGSVAFELPPQGQLSLPLRVHSGAAGVSSTIEVLNLRGRNAAGDALPARVEGDGQVEIRAE
ncbi:secretin N-terminal domain-containing protein [Paucibacter sp. M5-1]|uniref:secretin N-terminal domain-containing protein n=1 Tax=Paucibacter sp. M5-1 TaxID=3015998 RepID=UPI0022B936B8|nr:secretin N-terminal domain-containing protein [Paucibacter sp. M5-1]MCZ7882203.1 hypothetical protein [Paucibacter sp. M5-1]